MTNRSDQVFPVLFAVLWGLVLIAQKSYSQDYVVEAESSESVQRAVSFGKALVEDFEFGLGKYASVVEARFYSSPASTRVFESKARLERFEDGSIIWMKNIWGTDDIADDRQGDRRNIVIPVYKNCHSEIVVIDSKIFEMEILNSSGTKKKPRQPKLMRSHRIAIECGFGVAPRDWPFVLDSCITHAFACDDLLPARFAPGMRCLAARIDGNRYDTIWSGAEVKPGWVKGLSRIVFEDELPVLYEAWFSEKKGFSTGPGVINFSKAIRPTQVKTRWKKLNDVSVPEKVEAIFYTPGSVLGYEEIFVEATLEFYLPESKEFAMVQERSSKLVEQARKMSESKVGGED